MNNLTPVAGKFNIDIDSRFRIVREGDPYTAPGICFICKEAPGGERFFLDLGITVQRFGRLYICNYNFDEIARVFNYVKFEGSALQMANDSLIKLQDQIEMYKNVLTSFEGAISELERFHSAFSLLNSSISESLADVPTDEQNIGERERSKGNSRTEVSESPIGREEDIEGTEEPSSESRSSDISESSSIDHDLLDF